MAAVEPALTLRGDARVRRRRIVNRVAEFAATIAALAALAVLGIVIFSVAKRGGGELSWGFLTEDLPTFGQTGGGIAPLIVGSAILVGIATAIALPLGVLTALFLSEFAPRRLAAAIQLTIDLMNGLPSVIIGIFVFGLLVYGHTQSGYAGGFALSIVMLPLIARSTQEVLRLVPRSQREAALALGVSRWRIVVGIVLPSTLGGILTGTVLAIARAAGETAPLLFTASIFVNQVTLRRAARDAEHPGPDLHLVGVARSRGSPARLGLGVRADRVRPRDEPAGTPGAGPHPQEAQPVTQVTMPPMRPVDVAERREASPETREPVFEIQGLTARYGTNVAIKDVNLEISRNLITAVIGPSGCGKSTFIRCLNRMNDEIPSFDHDGQILYHGIDLYGEGVDPVEVRRRIGMVFQKPNPFPKTIYDNVAWAPRVLGLKQGLDERVEQALRGAALWDEVKDRLKKSALSLSGGQQQRLCIARAIAIEPEVLLLDEPASALDPIATASIEELMHSLKEDYTLVIVTHNMQQAARVADRTAFFSLDVDESGARAGVLVEYDETTKIFTAPSDKRTEDYVTGRFG